MLRQSVSQATQSYLDVSTALETLRSRKHDVRDRLRIVIHQVLGDRVAKESKMIVFDQLWEVAWPARSDACLSGWIAAVVIDSISKALNGAARKGFEAGFRTIYKHHVPRSVEELMINQFMEHVWDENLAISILFPKWTMSGWLTSSTTGTDHEKQEEALSGCREALDQAWRATLDAMQLTYGSAGTTETSDRISCAIRSIVRCRVNLYEIAMMPLARANVNDETGLGPYFGMLTFEEGDRFLRGLHRIVREEAFPEQEMELLEVLSKNEQVVLGQLSNRSRETRSDYELDLSRP